MYHAARLLDADHESKSAAAAMAKVMSTETSFKVCDEALQLHGGYGYLKVDTHTSLDDIFVYLSDCHLCCIVGCAYGLVFAGVPN